MEQLYGSGFFSVFIIYFKNNDWSVQQDKVTITNKQQGMNITFRKKRSDSCAIPSGIVSFEMEELIDLLRIQRIVDAAVVFDSRQYLLPQTCGKLNCSVLYCIMQQYIRLYLTVCMLYWHTLLCVASNHKILNTIWYITQYIYCSILCMRIIFLSHR